MTSCWIIPARETIPSLAISFHCLDESITSRLHTLIRSQKYCTLRPITDYKILHVVVTRNSLKYCHNLSISVQSLMTCCIMSHTETLFQIVSQVLLHDNYMAISRYASGPVAKLHTSLAHANLINPITHSHKSWNNTPSVASSSYNNPVY